MSGRELLLARLKEETQWAILDELARKSESELAAILHPDDEAGFRNDEIVAQRLRLDKALDELTLLEIACEVGLFHERDLDILKQESLHELSSIGNLAANFKKLVVNSEAFLRYADAYLYFGVRILAYRLFGPAWSPRATDNSDRNDASTNRRFFPLAVPPTIGSLAEAEAGVESFLNVQENPLWAEALDFLDCARPDPHIASVVARGEYIAPSQNDEPVQFELWLRGLMPEATPQQSERFQRIRSGIIDWVNSRSTFYLSFQKVEYYAASPSQIVGASRPFGDEMVTNPLVARFALSDIYWIARILRADVSVKASVSYSRISWPSLLRSKATLEGKSEAERAELRRAEEIIRSVFDFVCDLVQNATSLTELRERKHFNPEDYPERSRRHKEQIKDTREWPAVFDEEMREIDRQRSRRTYTPSTFPPDEPLPETAAHADIYWSERLVTGKQPHNRIGVAFSGGGIRSATFNLGVLQGLQEFDLLRHVDYLSTVSGGGFIGSWLVGNVRRTRHWLGRETSWDESISHLRAYSSYLAPLSGLLSADTWTLGASWIRNAFLIQLTGLTWLFALLLCALGGRMLFVGVADAYPSVGLELRLPEIFPDGLYLPYVGLVALVMGILVAFSLIYNFANHRVETGKHSPSAIHVRRFAVLPSWIGAFMVATMLWSNAKTWVNAPPPQVHTLSDLGRVCLLRGSYLQSAAPAGLLQPNPGDYSFILSRAWEWIFFLLASHWIALLLIGWFALKPSITRIRSRVGPQARTHGFDLAKWRLAAITLWRSVWIGTLCMVVLYIALCAILYLYIGWERDPTRFASYAFVFGPALVLTAFTLSVVLFIGLSGPKSNEAQREWWTRFGAWLTIYAIISLAVEAGAIFGPRLAIMAWSATGTAMQTIKWSAVASGIGTVLAGLFAGNSSKTKGEGATSKKTGMELLAQAGGFMFILCAVIAAATVMYSFISNIASAAPPNATYWEVLADIEPWTFAAICAVVLLCGTLFSWFFEINIFGLSQFYRNRLVRCYLGATRWAYGARKPHAFTGFDFNDDFPLSDLKNNFSGPFPIFNCTLNLAGSADLALHSRHSASFSLTPLRCGADRPKVGYAPTCDNSADDNLPHPVESSYAGGVRVGQAVAVSGAAASPNMGYNTSPLVALLLTMFNVRLGWWFPNPGQKAWKESGLRFSLYYLSRELLGMADETRLFLNVSDGGHFENLGVYELIRRRCKVIIACDAECDEFLTFGGLGNLVRICATDFGAVIDLDVRSIRHQKDDHSLAHCAVGKIKYSNGSIGYLIYLKASVTGDEDIGVAQYRSVHPTFPHESTANQFFSEDQFESYRKLGQHVVRHSLRGNQPGEHPLAVAEKLADVMAPARTSGEAFLKHTQTLDRLWEQFRQSPALHSFVDELMQITPPIAVLPQAPSGAHQASEELCMALQLQQLMEDVFMDLQLDDFWEHPDNRGWAILFMRWARSPRFRTFWAQTHRTFGIRFEYFCEARLGLTRDKPIVRIQ
jgi:hypothetical protein